MLALTICTAGRVHVRLCTSLSSKHADDYSHLLLVDIPAPGTVVRPRFLQVFLAGGVAGAAGLASRPGLRRRSRGRGQGGRGVDAPPKLRPRSEGVRLVRLARRRAALRGKLLQTIGHVPLRLTQHLVIVIRSLVRLCDEQSVLCFVLASVEGAMSMPSAQPFSARRLSERDTLSPSQRSS